MDLRKMARYSRRMEHVMNGTLQWEMEQGIDQLVENEDWDIISVLTITAREVPARRMVDQLLEHEQFLPCVLPACFRREIRESQLIDSGSLRSRIFRDIDAVDMEEEEGIPDHIRQMAEDISDAAEQTRRSALQRELKEDHDAIREHIVGKLGEQMDASAEAVNALILIGVCSIFEDTRRSAALKIANHEQTVRRMADAGRAHELVQISRASGMESVARNIAETMTDMVDDLKAEENTRVLMFIAENHPEAEVRDSAAETLPEDWDEQQ